MIKLVKFVSLLIVITLTVSLFVGCSKSTEQDGDDNQSPASSKPTVEDAKQEEPLKFVFYNYHNDSEPEPDNEMLKWINETKNVDITYQSELLGEKVIDKLNLLAAGGDLPDVCSFEAYPSAVEIIQRMGEAGLVIPMDEWIGKYPDLIKLSDPEYNELLYKNKKDGKMYFIPTNFAAHPEVLMADVGPIVREDWLKQVGMDAPKTTDELYEVLKAFRDQIPDVDGKKIIPATFDGFKQFIADAWTKSWWRLSDDFKTLTYQFMDPEIEEYMVYMNKLYREKLLDPEFITQQTEAYMSKLSTGRTGFSVRVYWDLDKVNAVLKEKNPQTRFIPSPPIRVEEKGFVPIYANPNHNAFSLVTISSEFAKDQANLEKLMEFLDWTTKDETVLMFKYGPEDKYYTKNSEGKLEMKPEFKEESEKPNNTFVQSTGLGFYNLLNINIIPSPEANPRTEESAMGNEIWREALQPMPLELQLTTAGPIEQEKWGEMWAEFDKWTAKAVLADSEEECRKTTQEMLKAFETNGGRDIINERLEAIEEFIKNK